MQLEDAPAVAELHNAAFEVDGGYRITPGEVRTDMELTGADLAHNTLVAVEGDGSLAAVAWCQMPDGASTEQRLNFHWNMVAPNWRDRGLGAFVLEWCEARGKGLLTEGAVTIPAVFKASAYDWQRGRLDLFASHGYQRVRYFTEMLRDLREPLETTAPPQGIEIRPWSEALAADAMDVHNDAFRDHWGSQPMTAERWSAFRDEFFLPEASFVAYDATGPVGLVLSSKYPHDFEDRGRTESWVEDLGTARRVRGRGIGTALLLAAMDTFRADGMEYACLGVDSASPTGADRLYARAGFVPEKVGISLMKAVDRTGSD